MKNFLEKVKRIPVKKHAEKVEELYEKYEHFLGPLGMALGVTFDALAFRRIDLLPANLILLGYILIGAGGIVLVNLYEEGKIKGKVFDRMRLWLPLIIQYSFGGLLSAFMVFYLRSTTITSSLVFFAILLGLIISNELLRKKYLKLTLQVSIYFFTIYSYAIFVLPIVFKKIGLGVFVLSSAVGVVVISLFVYLLSKVTPERIRQSRKFLIGSLVGILLLINILYFTNLIPPIPLGLKSAGVYRSVQRVGNTYQVVTEERRWYQFLSKETIHIAKGEPVYVFSAVFSPTDLDIPIVHHWQYKDAKTGKWVTSDKLSYRIIGGRDGGYRGYSFKQAVTPGEWRVDVETERGQIVGRAEFVIEEKTGGVIKQEATIN